MPPTHIGSVLLTKDALDFYHVTTPDGEASYEPSDPYISKVRPNEIYLVFQHSKSAGCSAMLLHSNVVGTFTTHEDARKYLHELKEKRRPIVKRQNQDGEGPKELHFWCAGDPNDEEECGFRFTSEGGEEFTVWIEGHEVDKLK